MTGRRSRQYRRVAQACENCRRKKIRCPGQKPDCSACTRLSQECIYKPEDTPATHKGDRRMSDRLSRVEARLDQIIDRIIPPDHGQSSQSMQEVTPASTQARHAAMSTDSPLAWSPEASPRTTPRESIDIALNVYFERIHRQPLWLLDPDSIAPPETSEELMCIILALSITCCPSKFTSSDLKGSDFYASRASSLAISQVATQDVSIQTLQCLCLLSLYNVITGDLHLAGMNVGITRSALYHFLLGPTEAPVERLTKERSKIFWSLNCLECLYGAPLMVSCIPDKLSNPQSSILEPGSSTTFCLPLPERCQETTSDSIYDSLTDIWSQSIRMHSLWQEARMYIVKCIEGLSEAPWHPTSTYNKLCAHIIDIEEVWPTRLTYNTGKFQDRSPEEIQMHRETWILWIKAQIIHHAVHCVINHPFLYSFEAHKSISATNTFWRVSFEKALRHCTWVSRLIRLSREKGLVFTDPFFAQAAGIAGSLHLYWMRARDESLRQAAAKNLQTCQDFLSEMATSWPLCKSIERGLESLVETLHASDRNPGAENLTISGPMSLMWTLLDISAPQFPSYPGERSYKKATWAGHIAQSGALATAETDLGSSPRDMRESTAHYASPPEWTSSRTDDAGSMPLDGDQRLYSSGAVTLSSEAVTGSMGFPQDDIIVVDQSWAPLEYMMRLGDSTSAPVDWWEFGNL